MPPWVSPTPKRSDYERLNETLGSRDHILDDQDYDFLRQSGKIGSSFTFPEDMNSSMHYGIETPEFYDDAFGYRSFHVHLNNNPTMNHTWPRVPASLYSFNFLLGNCVESDPFNHDFHPSPPREQYTGSSRHFSDFFEGIGGPPFQYRGRNAGGRTGSRSQAGSRPWMGASNHWFHNDHYDYDQARPRKRMRTEYSDRHWNTYMPESSRSWTSRGFAQPDGDWGRPRNYAESTEQGRTQLKVGDDWGIFDMDDPDFEKKEREWELANGFGPEKKRKYEGDGTRERPWEL